MEKKTIQEIARILVGKNGLQPRDAEQFAAMMFSVIRDGLERDGLVKVRGFGTFKMVDVEARESVSVKTGERVLIQGHQKVTFTPDATMKELVNKPFSQFETVVLNDGVDFDDIKEEAKVPQEEVEVPQEEVEVQQEKVEEPQETVVAPVALMAAQEPAPEQETTEEPAAAEEPAEQPEEPIEQPEEPAAAEEPAEQPEEPAPAEESVEAPIPEPVFIYQKEESGSKWPWALLTLVLMAASAAGGYYFGTRQVQQNAVEAEVAEIVDEPVVPADTIVMDSVKTNVDSAALTQPQPETAKPVEAKPAETKPAETKPVAKPEQPTAANDAEDKYAKADPRLRYGAYRIVGENGTVKVRAGETTARIAKRTLGPDMECYIEAFNGIKSNAELKEGQTVKIPKLELKKKKRQ